MRPAELAFALDEVALSEWLLGRRWFASKARDVAHVHVLDAVVLHDGVPGLVVACVEARFHAGTHELYQLLLAMRPSEEAWERDVVAHTAGVTVYEALADPAASAVLGRLLRERAEVDGATAHVSFRWVEDGAAPPADHGSVRAMGAEQSNSSLVFDDALVLKAYRRVEAGVNPELEMLRFLSEREFPNIAPLRGWYEYRGELMEATFGVVQDYVAGGRDGWELALDELGSEPEAFLARLRELGVVVAQMHTLLGSDGSDPAFVPEEPSEETLALLTATIDEQIEQVFLDLPPDDPDVEPIAGRGEEVRDRLRLLSQLGERGRLIRHHGDLHLGQTLLVTRAHAPAWIILDFEGEPARPLLERRRKRSPLRDVAGMLRSFAYAASASSLQRGIVAPSGWEERAREEFLDGYFETVDQTLLPHGPAAARALLSIFELEKAVYELRYELNNRPDWVRIPVAGIARLMEEDESG